MDPKSTMNESVLQHNPQRQRAPSHCCFDKAENIQELKTKATIINLLFG